MPVAQDDLQLSAPDIAREIPFAFRFGAVGAGIGVGCGVGIGFGGPLSLGSIPALGPAVQSITAGLGGISGMMMSSGASARQAVRSLGVQGLDAGLGCGVGIGYGFGAGLMLRPSVVDQAVTAGTHLLTQLTSAISQQLQGVGLMPQTHPSSSSSSSGGRSSSSSSSSQMLVVDSSLGSNSAASSPQQVVTGLSSDLGTAASSVLLPAATGQRSITQPAGPHDISNLRSQLQEQQPDRDPLVARTLLQLQSDVRHLKRQNKLLRQAVCKLDPKSALCSSSSSNSRRSRRSVHDGTKLRWPAGSADGVSSDWSSC